MPETADSNLPVKDVIRHLTHELRQPLSALESIAFYLQMTIGGGAGDVSVQVDRLQQMVDSLNWVVSDVIHLMHMTPPNPESVNIHELTEEVLAESWISEGLTFQQDLDPEMPGAWADLEQLRHLLRSALQFLRRSAAEPREVAVSGTTSAASFQLMMRTNAPAVVPEELFNPLEPNQLLTCRRIAENNGGRFRAEKDGQGRLSLCLDLPVALA